MAPAVKTFLNRQNWRGKTVVPFSTSGGWPGHVIKDIKAACQGAEFGPSMEVRFDSNGGSQPVTTDSELKAWIQSVEETQSERKKPQ